MQYLMSVPMSLLAQVSSGAAKVDGAMVKSAGSGKILAHLQQSGKLANALSGGPVGAAAAVVDAASSIAGNVQLEQIKGMLSTLQVVAGVGAAASILNLGVSVGGFALVLRRLDKINERIASVGNKVDSLRGFLDRVQLAKMRTALDRCENAYRRSEHDRERVWRDEERYLDEAVNIAQAEVEALASRDPQGRLKLWEAELDAKQIAECVEVPLLCVQVRLEALLLLNNPEEARRVAEKLRGWIDALDINPRAYVKAHRGAIPLGSKEISIAVGEATNLEGVFRAAALQARDRAALCEAVIAQKLDSRRVVEEVREHPAPTVLMLKAADVD